MHIQFPLQVDSSGRTAQADSSTYIRNLIEQVLFTMPGERVNRLDFGSNVRSLLFSPNSDVLAAATQALVQASLQQWLGDLIEVHEVSIENEEATLRVVVQYTVLRTQESQQVEFSSRGEVQ